MVRYLEVQPHLLFPTDILLLFSYILCPLSLPHNVRGSKQEAARLTGMAERCTPQRTQSKEALDDIPLLRVTKVAIEPRLLHLSYGG